MRQSNRTVAVGRTESADSPSAVRIPPHEDGLNVESSRPRLSPRPGAVVMQPTTLCQLDCSYCYLPFRHRNLRMPVQVAGAVATSVNAWRAAGQPVEVIWHGGEPLAAGREHLAALMKPFHGVDHTVQTNAALIDDAWCAFLAEHRVGVGVSIDGPAHMDAQRRTRGGRPAHEAILRGINCLRRHGIPFSAIAVVSRPNPATAADFYAFFAELGCTALGVNIEEQEGVNDTAPAAHVEEATVFWGALLEAWRAHPVVQLRELERVLGFADAVLHERIGARPAQPPWDPLPTIAHDGTVVLLSPELAGFTDQRFGDFSTGNVLHTPLHRLLAEAEERTGWLEEFWRGVDACRATCPAWAFCGGGHAANRYFEHGGRLDGTRTHYCTTAKIALLEGATRHAHAHCP